jgi:hypothetical protein
VTPKEKIAHFHRKNAYKAFNGPLRQATALDLSEIVEAQLVEKPIWSDLEPMQQMTLCAVIERLRMIHSLAIQKQKQDKLPQYLGIDTWTGRKIVELKTCHSCSICGASILPGHRAYSTGPSTKQYGKWAHVNCVDDIRKVKTDLGQMTGEA